ncbi:unnamed protein product [Vicia faba]|uniref:NAC domain-containing protein n=1 Tax=Vicia faba TaxID=3906 RepID=A0AAV1A6U2_VICFA|nr:unnamed protein product [Vicia faba]
MKALNDCSTKDFMPTDEELLQNFLYNKINNEPIPNYLNILEYDLFGTEKTSLNIWNEFEASHSYSEKDLYFFTTLKKNSTTSMRSIHTIGNGNWEGEDTGKNIFAKDTNQLLGLKKRFRFEKSNTSQDGGWILHEYKLHKSFINNAPVNNYVLCRFRKNLKSQNTQARASIGDQFNSHLRKISRKKIVKRVKKKLISKEREPIIPKQAEPVISGNNVSVKKYGIYEEAIVGSNDGGNKRKYEDDIEFAYMREKRKCIRSTRPEEEKFIALKTKFEYEYNNLFFGENIAQNPKNRDDSRNSEIELVERTKKRECSFNKDDSDIIMNKEEEDDDDEMSWSEIFAMKLLEINGGGRFIK